MVLDPLGIRSTQEGSHALLKCSWRAQPAARWQTSAKPPLERSIRYGQQVAVALDWSSSDRGVGRCLAWPWAAYVSTTLPSPRPCHPSATWQELCLFSNSSLSTSSPLYSFAFLIWKSVAPCPGNEGAQRCLFIATDIGWTSLRFQALSVVPVHIWQQTISECNDHIPDGFSQGLALGKPSSFGWWACFSQCWNTCAFVLHTFNKQQDQAAQHSNIFHLCSC